MDDLRLPRMPAIQRCINGFTSERRPFGVVVCANQANQPRFVGLRPVAADMEADGFARTHGDAVGVSVEWP